MLHENPLPKPRYEWNNGAVLTHQLSQHMIWQLPASSISSPLLETEGIQ